MGVEHPDTSPVVAVLVDEDQMLGSGLVRIMGGLIAKDDMQTDLEIAIVDLTLVFGSQRTDGEERHTGVVLQIGMAGPDQPVDRLLGGILQCEEDVVGKHGAGRCEKGGSGETYVKSRWFRLVRVGPPVATRDWPES